MRILVHPDQLRKVSKDFVHASKENEQIARNLKLQMNLLEQSWRGSVQQDFFKNFIRTQKIMQNYVLLLSKIGNELLSIAERFEEADENKESKVMTWGKVFLDTYHLGNGYVKELLPGLASITSGFRFKKSNGKFIVYGKRNPTTFLENSYIKWRTEKLGIPLNATVYNTNPLATNSWKIAKESLTDGFKGGALAETVISVGLNAYEYTLGGHRAEGIMSSGFLSSTTVELGKGVLQTGVSMAAGALATAAVTATAGSVVPGIGTAVGFGVGLGLAVLDNTKIGKSVTEWTEDKVQDVYQSIGKNLKRLGHEMKETKEEIVGTAKEIKKNIDSAVDNTVDAVSDTFKATSKVLNGWSKALFD
ncbi:WXG100 family type VII secretion target [Priestia aryabhattai]|uniref:WXG100 family type VII secretion target n=1 Tax=Priestia aryabhattai TaxID=412384 RepID=UPI001FB40E9B|nr:WXG100 family type VII secretion target [Priestia aryabhattai]